MYDAAKFYARDTGVEEQYFRSYDETASLLRKRQDPEKNFISARNVELKPNVQDIEKLDQEFPNVDGMIKSVFPQLMADENDEVGLALNCIHEINLKPGTKPVKQKVRRVPVNLRAELKKSIDSMLALGIIRHSTSELASVLIRKKT